MIKAIVGAPAPSKRLLYAFGAVIAQSAVIIEMLGARRGTIF